ncbi:MAG: M28 family peptidase [Gemmatimonadetes bacterium]|nr:M28 family peptidase [Gemmatimonadota bacterium]
MPTSSRARETATFLFALLCLISPSLSPAVAAGDAEPLLSNVRQLTYEGERAGEGYFSADGKHLVFQSERLRGNPFYQIYSLDLETGDAIRVSPGIGKTTCAFYRPGTNDVLFASTHGDPDAEAKQREEIAFRESGKTRRYSWDYDEHMDLYVADRAGLNVRRLTEARGYDAEGAYSPDGRLVVFSSLRAAYDRELSAEEAKRLEQDPSYFGDLYIMNADGSNVTRLTDEPGYDGGPFFSPDGKRVIWRRFDETGAIADVYSMSIDGTDIVRLTDFGAMSWAPYYHPSGEYAIFTANKHGFGNFELFIVDANGAKEPVRVTFTDGFDGLPVFDPAGTRLAWTAGRTSDEKSQLFLANWDHDGALAMLSRSSARGEGPTALIDRAELHAKVEYLASDELEGRMTGSPGARAAGDYLAGALEAIGFEPLPGLDGYRQRFTYSSGVSVDPASALTIVTGEESRALALDHDFRPVSFSENGTFEGDVVFAGYGLSVPGGLGEGYDSYRDLDVQDKIVLVLRAIPEEVDQKRRLTLNRYAGLRYKALAAREAGAKGLLVVNGPSTKGLSDLVTLRSEVNASTSGIAIASIRTEVAENMFRAAGYDLAEVQAELDLENPHFEGSFALEGVTASLAVELERERQGDDNIVAWLPAPDGANAPQYVVLGAHYDHIGHGEVGSLARDGEHGEIHNGADDNASGTAVVLEIAEAIAARRAESPEAYKRGVIVTFWSGEELGLVGSAYYVENPPVPNEQVVAYLNFDMVGRLRENQLTLQGLGSSSIWKGLAEKKNVAAGFQLSLQDDPYLPTDATSFYTHEVPVVHFFTGSHEEYNRPVDDTETLNYEGMERVAKFALAMTEDLVRRDDRPDYAKVERSDRGGGRTANLRAYLGTIPNYTQEGVDGVKLDAVRPGAPADDAGLEGGDVIVELAGQRIANIYDYTYAIEALKIGEETPVVVMRDNVRIELTIIPGSRE